MKTKDGNEISPRWKCTGDLFDAIQSTREALIRDDEGQFEAESRLLYSTVKLLELRLKHAELTGRLIKNDTNLPDFDFNFKTIPSENPYKNISEESDETVRVFSREMASAMSDELFQATLVELHERKILTSHAPKTSAPPPVHYHYSGTITSVGDISCIANFTAECDSRTTQCYYTCTTFYAPGLPSDKIPKPIFNGEPSRIADVLEKMRYEVEMKWGMR